MRVLVAAFACDPGRGSEPGVGWAVAAGAAGAGHDVVVVTQPRNRGPIEAARRDDPALAARLGAVYVGLPGPLMAAWDRRGGLRGLQLYNMAWQLALWRAGRRLHRERPFDVAHHVTLSTDWVPSGLAWVPGLPLVWGPLGGGERVPRPCRAWLGTRGRLREALRRSTADPLRVLLGRRAGRRAALLVAQNPDEARRWRGVATPVVVRPNVFLETGGGTAAPAPDRAGRRPRAVFAGRLLAWKGIRLALATMTRPEVADWELHVYGDGSERRSAERIVRRHGLAGRVVLHGSRPRDEVRAAMAAADALLYPSMREAAGWVVAEALEAGCPVVCLDVGGPPVLLAGTGRAVPPGGAMPGDLARALVEVAAGPRTVVRWERAAVPGLLADWYGAALGTGVPAGDGSLHAR
jgi:glycosyltransferase involved in cell wall biosynthesis